MTLGRSMGVPDRRLDPVRFRNYIAKEAGDERRSEVNPGVIAPDRHHASERVEGGYEAEAGEHTEEEKEGHAVVPGEVETAPSHDAEQAQSNIECVVHGIDREHAEK